MQRSKQMQVRVWVELMTQAAEKHLAEMQSAAEAMTDDRSSIHVSIVNDDAKTMVAEFTMPKARQMDIVVKIMHRFALYMHNYNTQSIAFPQPTRKRSKRKANQTLVATR